MNLWRAVAWLVLACGLIAWVLGWAFGISGTQPWNLPGQVWFYDAITSGVFAIFFMVYAADSDRRKAK